jgi:DNA mismatch repair protein MutS2
MQSNMNEIIRSSDPTPADEIHLRRLTTDEAVTRLDKFLHDAYLSGLREVKVVHGKGTGTLRLMVIRELTKNPLVRSFRGGGRGEGSRGVTVVEMAEG